MPVPYSRLGQRDRQVVYTSPGQTVPIWLFDVVRFDLSQDFAVDIHCLALGQFPDPSGEARVLVAPSQIVVDAGTRQPILKISPLRVIPHGLFVVVQRFAPALLRLQFISALEHLLQ